MNIVFPPAVDAEQETDQQDACAGGADDVRQHGAEKKDAAVVKCGWLEVAAHYDATGHGVQRAEQDNEGGVFAEFVHEWVQGFLAGRCMQISQVQDDRRGEDGDDNRLVAIVVSEATGCEGQHGDAEQQESERHDTPD